MEIFKIENTLKPEEYDLLEKDRFYEEVKVTTEVTVGDDGVKVVLSFYLKNAYNDNLFANVYYDYTNHRISKCFCCFCDLIDYNHSEECKHIVYLLNKYNNHQLEGSLTKDEFYLFICAAEEKYRQNQEIIQKEEMKKLLGTLEEELDKAIVTSNNSIHLLPSIKYEENRIQISLKIGTEKYYIVKDIREFLYKVRDNKTYEYGKSLKISHNINNFDFSSKKCIEVLYNYSYNSYWDDSKMQTLSPKACQEVIEAYKNKIISINGCDCVIALEDFVPNISIKNDNINFEDVDNISYIPGSDYDFIVKNNTIYKLVCDNEMRVFVKFLINNRNFNYNIIKDEFAKKIVSRLMDSIVVDEDFKNEFMIKDLVIKAYFDYNKDELSLDVKYFSDENEISEKDVQNNNFVSKKYTKFWSIINSFGFENYRIKDINLVGNFLTSNLEELKEHCEIYLSNNIKDMRVRKFGTIKTSVSYNSGMLNICFKDLNFSNEELSKIINGMKKNLKYIKLSKNVILKTDDISSNQLLNIVEEFNLKENKLNEKQVIPLYQGLKLADNSSQFGDIEIDKKIKEMINEIANYKESDYEVPSAVKDVLRNYQINAFKWMKTLVKYNFCGILADDMGLGKTLEIISLIISDDNNKPSLIVSPKSLIYNWQNEFKKWANNVDVEVISGNSNDREKIIKTIENNKKVIFITSYDSLRNDLDLYNNCSFRFSILDEAQFIKNHTTLKAQSVKQIKSEIRFALTGTPIENTVVDLWSLFDFLMPNYLFNYKNFRTDYEKEIINKKNSSVIKKLVKKITPFILRRTKKEVLNDLPDKIEMVRYTTMENEQLKVYEAQLLKTREMLEKKTSKIEILSALTRMRQICVHPKMFIDNFKGESAKINLLMELLEELIENGHKVLIFSQFTSVFDYISEKLKEKNIDYFILTGKTPALLRVNMADIFNKKTSPQKVFLISLKAGGTGLNLIGADTVIQLDPWWNVAAENQASDRAHRIGQQNVVQVIKIICENSIEQKVLELQELKKDIVDKVIADNDENIIKLSENDLEYLLK